MGLRVFSQLIVPPEYAADVRKAATLKRQAAAIDKRLEKARERWFEGPASPLLITLHEDTGDKLPGGVRLQMDHDVSISAIHRRQAAPVGDLNAVPDAVLENVTYSDLEFAVDHAI